MLGICIIRHHVRPAQCGSKIDLLCVLHCNAVKHHHKIVDCPINIILGHGRGIALAFLGSERHRRGVSHIRERRKDRIYNVQRNSAGHFEIAWLILLTCISNVGRGMVKQLSFMQLYYNRYFLSCIA